MKWVYGKKGCGLTRGDLPTNLKKKEETFPGNWKLSWQKSAEGIVPGKKNREGPNIIEGKG